MSKFSQFNNRCVRFQELLLEAIDCFKIGQEHLGINAMLDILDDLENLVEHCEYCSDKNIHIESIVLILRNILKCIENQDVVGMTDALEFSLYPLTIEWIKEVVV
ncbi:hypothetical protein PV797_07105 [Clostridiaceae bacterium M8S5]|nr:hypothetical protein PV797_07105 [Clostridiaceae bacterium M8S5]